MLEAILQVGIQLNFYWDGSQASRKSLQIKLFKLDRNLVIEITVPNDKLKKKKKISWIQKKAKDWGEVWIRFIASTFCFQRVSAIFFFFGSRTCWLFVCEQCICAIFMDPQISFFSNFFIKNGSHGIIHIFKNYFAIVFSVFNFQFQHNKFYPNRP